MAQYPDQTTELVGGALGPLEAMIAHVDSLAEKGVSYMLSVVGAALLIYLAISGVTGAGELGTGEFIALAAAATLIAVAGAGFRALTSRVSLEDATRVTESALEIVGKVVDDAAEARRGAEKRGS